MYEETLCGPVMHVYPSSIPYCTLAHYRNVRVLKSMRQTLSRKHARGLFLLSLLFIGAVLFSAKFFCWITIASVSFVKLSLMLRSFYLCDKLASAFQNNHPPLF